MIKWCAFCQRFQGEVPPFERQNVTHGLCARCAQTASQITLEQEKRIQRLGDFFSGFWKAGREQNITNMKNLIDEALRVGIRPIDLLYGIAAPALAKIGDLWAKNEITVQEEHRFTKSCETFIDLIAQRIHKNVIPSRILLANVPGNEHYLGLRFTQLGLMSIGLASEIMPLGSSLNGILDYAKKIEAKTVGLSISLPEQLPDLLSAVKALTDARFSIRIIVSGGAAIKSGMISAKILPQNVLLINPVFDEAERDLFFVDSRSVPRVGN